MHLFHKEIDFPQRIPTFLNYQISELYLYSITMRNILILGAGRSSGVLIDYLVEKSAEQQWQLVVGDITAEQALQKTRNRPNTKAVSFDTYNEINRRKMISEADIVISMLPATLHIIIAEDCIKLKKNLVTPSYISDAMRSMDEEVKKKKLVFMNEIGLDPGIDHMSAMHIIQQLKSEGNTITGFRSHCGGLVAPESDDNLWHYKFSWNPRNVVLAGQGEGKILYLKNGKKVQLQYEELFGHTSELKIKGYGKFESYPNRDSLKYVSQYGLKGVKTMYRGTLRRPPYCKGWDALVKLGFTSHKQTFTTQFQHLVEKGMKDKKIITDKQTEKLIQSISIVPMLFLHKEKTVIPSDLLLNVLQHSWSMQPGDKDMVVMVHEVEYQGKRKKKKTLESSLVYTGKDADHTAMAATVGLPVAMVTKMILNGEVKRTGVLMPSHPEIYNPILAELKKHGISFKEKITE